MNVLHVGLLSAVGFTCNNGPAWNQTGDFVVMYTPDTSAISILILRLSGREDMIVKFHLKFSCIVLSAPADCKEDVLCIESDRIAKAYPCSFT